MGIYIDAYIYGIIHKIEKDGKIIAGIIARMYCWNVVYIDTLWVDSKL